jgi:uncharacterized membrane protein YhaH (DUF805 family)
MKKYPRELFKGRIGRKNYILGLLFLIGSFDALIIPIVLVDFGGISDILILSLYPLSIAFIIFVLSLHIRRLHDLGWSGFWVLILGLTIWFMLFMKGEKTKNEYGELPPKNDEFFDVVFSLKGK